ncbi:MAG: hypothetical protein LW817_00870, partial [Candidatus Caenarcaniphilales bacterium]|nr:hypothetical protein [Candidatus Caenarcaniphilales bacterium]
MILTNSLIVFLSFCAMEFAANFTHRYIMHGFMWFFHEDHHRPHKGFFEKNDIFFLIFAVPSACFIYFGLSRYFYALAAVGFGILLYGIAYFLVHEVLIHRRFTWLDK